MSSHLGQGLCLVKHCFGAAFGGHQTLQHTTSKYTIKTEILALCVLGKYMKQGLVWTMNTLVGVNVILGIQTMVQIFHSLSIQSKKIIRSIDFLLFFIYQCNDG